jgi:molecular chaperone DnaK
VAVLDCTTDPFRVVASCGDPFLGGDDIDRELARVVAARVLERDGWDLTSERETFERLVAACDEAKCRFSSVTDEAVPLNMDEIDPAAPASLSQVHVTRAELRALTLGAVQRTFALCDEVLKRARMTAADVEATFLAGGSTLLPDLRDYVGQYFGRRPRHDLDPLHAVALGASLAAARPRSFGALTDSA